MRVYRATGEGGEEYRASTLDGVDEYLRLIADELSKVDRDAYPARVMILEMDRDMLLDMRSQMRQEMVS